MGTDHGGGVPKSTVFARTLSTLKREGSNVLVVGECSGTAHHAACARLVGEGDQSRQRLYVYTSGTENCSDGPSSTHGGETRVLSQECDDGESASPAAVAGDVEEVLVGGELLGTLGARLLGTIDRFEFDHDPGPGEFRLCFDSVTPLLREHQSRTVFRLLHMVTSRTRQADGIGHFHLPLDRDSDYVRLLEPLFDAVVEVRRGDGDVLEQRWHLRDLDADSGWVAIG
ncbi:DUF7504 family protein [Haloarchaeobius sp. HRN-SO-5]|uniref:DUF7504 family protein n=1 Tax=Haloarchaeobius sp. HRN-SO-5 TaxID=3446118 RepID=UPI003EBB34AE